MCSNWSWDLIQVIIPYLGPKCAIQFNWMFPCSFYNPTVKGRDMPPDTWAWDTNSQSVFVTTTDKTNAQVWVLCARKWFPSHWSVLSHHDFTFLQGSWRNNKNSEVWLSGGYFSHLLFNLCTLMIRKFQPPLQGIKLSLKLPLKPSNVSVLFSSWIK